VLPVVVAWCRVISGGVIGVNTEGVRLTAAKSTDHEARRRAHGDLATVDVEVVSSHGVATLAAYRVLRRARRSLVTIRLLVAMRRGS
jgi:hypothetical protein